MDRGWVKLYRKVEDWEWYREPATAHLFFHLLISANRQDRKWNGIDVPAGCLITSIRHLADQTGLTIQQVRTSLKRLISTHDITQTSNKKYTLIKVNNYQIYQCPNTEVNTLVTQCQHSDNTLVTTNKKSRNQEIKKLIRLVIMAALPLMIWARSFQSWIKASVQMWSVHSNDLRCTGIGSHLPELSLIHI